MRSLPRIDVLDELRETNEALIELLRSLDTADWARPTIHRDRTVKDLAAHLLDGSLRRLAVQRDGFSGERFSGQGEGALVAFVQRLNREWIVAARRLSPKMLIDMLVEADAELFALLASIPPEAPAAFDVAWAGKGPSAHWFDVAREFTEKWHHQQQIRDAVDKPDLTSRRYVMPVIATFVRALPHAYRDVSAAEGTAVQLSVGGEATSVWCLTRATSAWQLEAKVVADPDCEVVVDGDVAWRLWTKSLAANDAPSRIGLHGEAGLAAPMLGMVCVMA